MLPSPSYSKSDLATSMNRTVQQYTTHGRWRADGWMLLANKHYTPPWNNFRKLILSLSFCLSVNRCWLFKWTRITSTTMGRRRTSRRKSVSAAAKECLFRNGAMVSLLTFQQLQFICICKTMGFVFRSADGSVGGGDDACTCCSWGQGCLYLADSVLNWICNYSPRGGHKYSWSRCVRKGKDNESTVGIIRLHEDEESDGGGGSWIGDGHTKAHSKTGF